MLIVLAIKQMMLPIKLQLMLKLTIFKFCYKYKCFAKRLYLSSEKENF